MDVPANQNEKGSSSADVRMEYLSESLYQNNSRQISTTVGGGHHCCFQHASSRVSDAKYEAEQARAESLQALPTMAAAAIFLASLTATLLSTRPGPSSSPNNLSDQTINACWLSSMTLSIVSCALTMLLYKDIVERRQKTMRRSFHREIAFRFSFLLMILSVLLLLVGTSVWTWNDFPRAVALASTGSGVGVCGVTLCLSVISSSRHIRKIYGYANGNDTENGDGMRM